MDMRIAAASVHVFTALGSVLALLATHAVIGRRFEEAFVWLGVAFIVDGIDGTFARWANVKERLPRFSGERLDLIVDYLTYVFVPVLALMQAGYLAGVAGSILAGAILLSSLFHFIDTDSKSEDHFFIGFPAVWNICAFYVFSFALPWWATGGLVVTCVALTFVPMHWIHPLRVVALRPLTIAFTVLWSIAAIATVWSGFPAAPGLKAALLAVMLYAVGLSVLWKARV